MDKFYLYCAALFAVIAVYTYAIGEYEEAVLATVFTIMDVIAANAFGEK